LDTYRTKGCAMENKIGDARREYADRNGKFTQEDAASYFNVSLSTYKKWEQGQGKLNGEQLRSIAKKYGTTVDYLLGISSIGFDELKKRALEYSETHVVEPRDILEYAHIRSNESKLLDYFRSMSDEGRERLLEQAELLAGKYPRDTAVEVRGA